jgi:hypothetical protein
MAAARRGGPRALPRSGGEGGSAVERRNRGAIDDPIGIPDARTRLPVTPQRSRELLRDRSPH